MNSLGNLLIVSGPSGAGKSRISAGVLEVLREIRFSVSYTTREPRPSETDGIDYHFVSRDRFVRLKNAGEFLETAEVYGNLYGTSARFIDEARSAGIDVLLDVDVQGAKTIRTRCPDATSVFILPPSFARLKERLENRQQDKEYVIAHRLSIACEESRRWPEYDYLIINNELGHSIEELKTIVLAARCRSSVRSGVAQAILETFGGGNA